MVTGAPIFLLSFLFFFNSVKFFASQRLCLAEPQEPLSTVSVSVSPPGTLNLRTIQGIFPFCSHGTTCAPLLAAGLAKKGREE